MGKRGPSQPNIPVLAEQHATGAILLSAVGVADPRAVTALLGEFPDLTVGGLDISEALLLDFLHALRILLARSMCHCAYCHREAAF